MSDLDGFDPDAALEEIRALVYERHGNGNGDPLADLVGTLDHWIIVGERLPAEWACPEPGVVAERVMSRQRKQASR